MKNRDDRLIYAAVGPLVAILLGIALVPLRETALLSSLEIPFIIVTIVAGELGGVFAALSAALVSTFSLDFFLKTPYLTLTLFTKHDVTTFLGLVACGVVAAALGARRDRTSPSTQIDPARD